MMYTLLHLKRHHTCSITCLAACKEESIARKGAAQQKSPMPKRVQTLRKLSAGEEAAGYVARCSCGAQAPAAAAVHAAAALYRAACCQAGAHWGDLPQRHLECHLCWHNQKGCVPCDAAEHAVLFCTALDGLTSEHDGKLVIRCCLASAHIV